MKGEIEGEDGEYLKIHVTDNNGTEHDITIEIESGNIAYHEQEGYPDKPDKRTHTQGEHVGQARRYAQYYVAQQTEHNTLPWDLDSDRFETVIQALESLTVDEIEEYFGELFAQSLSHYEDDPEVDIGEISRPYTLPADMSGGEDAIRYEQEIYLDEHNEIEAVSGIIMSYYVAKGEQETKRHGTAPDRDPDARVEVYPAPLVELEPFREYLVYNLQCQIRDCYLMLGLEPPQEYKILGHGQYRFTGKYHHFDMYPEYHNTEADIPGYSHEFRPDLPISWEEIGGLVNPTAEKSIYDQIKDSLFRR